MCVFVLCVVQICVHVSVSVCVEKIMDVDRNFGIKDKNNDTDRGQVRDTAR